MSNRPNGIEENFYHFSWCQGKHRTLGEGFIRKISLHFAPMFVKQIKQNETKHKSGEGEQMNLFMDLWYIFNFKDNQISLKF